MYYLILELSNYLNNDIINIIFGRYVEIIYNTLCAKIAIYRKHKNRIPFKLVLSTKYLSYRNCLTCDCDLLFQNYVYECLYIVKELCRNHTEVCYICHECRTDVGFYYDWCINAKRFKILHNLV